MEQTVKREYAYGKYNGMKVSMIQKIQGKNVNGKDFTAYNVVIKPKVLLSQDMYVFPVYNDATTGELFSLIDAIDKDKWSTANTSKENSNWSASLVGDAIPDEIKEMTAGVCYVATVPIVADCQAMYVCDANGEPMYKANGDPVLETHTNAVWVDDGLESPDRDQMIRSKLEDRVNARLNQGHWKPQQDAAAIAAMADALLNKKTETTEEHANGGETSNEVPPT